MHELTAIELTKTYREKTAVREMSFTLANGVYGLLGENGAGKTTLMRMLCGLLAPDSGQVLCNGVPIARLGGGYRRLLGYLPQSFGYYPDYSALRFLRYMAALKALPGEYADARIEELLELTGLAGERNQKLKTFSGGMLKRVGIAQALLNDPQILILDEPTAGLDPKERVRFRNLLSSLGRNRIILLSTHIVSDIESIADEILMMQKGCLAASGSVDEITAAIKGCVWECLVSERKAAEFEQTHIIANLRNQEDGVRFRVVSREAPAPGAKSVEPALEDAYLYYLNHELTPSPAGLSATVQHVS